MVLGRKRYGILKSGYSHSLLDSVCAGVQSRVQDAMPGKACTSKEARVLAQGPHVSNQSPLPTTSQEHGTASKMSIYGNTYVGHMIWKPSRTCSEDVDTCLECKGNALPHDHPTAKSFYPRPQKLNGVNIWWTVGERSGTIYPNVFRTRRDQIRTLCTLRSRTVGRGHVGPLLVRRCFSSNYDTPLYKSRSAYYEILQVSPTATQAQIKTAYYKQSFIYHPDKNAGSEEATHRFAEISEAYNVLGNKSLRKKYDRGILTPTDLQGARRPTAKDTGSSAGQQTRPRSSVADINGQKIYDFDTFIKSHYSEQLQRERQIRARQEEIQRKKEESKHGRSFSRISEMTVGMLLAMAIALFLSVKSTK